MAMPQTLFDIPPTFDGDAFDKAADQRRLSDQHRRVWAVMSDGAFRTLREIAQLTGDETHSISARLRDFRKEKFGRHTVQRRRRAEAERGIHEYRLEQRT